MKIVFSDFDGTLTSDGQLSTVFFDLIDLVDRNDSELIIVSGRSISWGHFLLTHFPLKYVIMEGGGVILSKSSEGIIQEENLISSEEILRLENLSKTLMLKVPECIMSVDSFGRRTDRAIEFSQMSEGDIASLEAFLKNHKINFSRSNVHINFWIGELSKSNAASYFLGKYRPHIKPGECIFYGDAANDESMFKLFENTVGVSNILDVLEQLEYKPRVVLEGRDNAGIYGVYHHLRETFNLTQKK